MINFEPCPGLVVIEPIEEESSFVVASDKVQTQKGRVIKCGKSFITEKGNIILCPVQIGDIILHSLFGHQTFKHEGKEYRIVKFTEILLIYTYVSEN